MQDSSSLKKRFQELLERLCTLHQWRWRELARALDYDPGKLHKVGENPKLTMVLRVAELLEWPVQSVIDYWAGDGQGLPPDELDEYGMDFQILLDAARTAHAGGQFKETVALAGRAFATAPNADSRAWACNLEACGWGGQGFYTKGIEGRRRGLEQEGVSTGMRRLLEVNIANGYYMLGEVLEARGIAESIADWYAHNPAPDRLERGNHAFAYYVLGMTSLCLIGQDPDQALLHAAAAKQSCEESCRLWALLPGDLSKEYWGAIANTCRGGIIEAEVTLGLRDPHHAIDELWRALPGELDAQSAPVGEWLETWGWWCIFGCDVALRYLSEIGMQHPMAEFTLKGHEIADELGNWALRERIFLLEYLGKGSLAKLTRTPVIWPLDNEDKQVLIGTMGRFPRFFRTGCEILAASN